MKLINSGRRARQCLSENVHGMFINSVLKNGTCITCCMLLLFETVPDICTLHPNRIKTNTILQHSRNIGGQFNSTLPEQLSPICGMCCSFEKTSVRSKLLVRSSLKARGSTNDRFKNARPKTKSDMLSRKCLTAAVPSRQLGGCLQCL